MGCEFDYGDDFEKCECLIEEYEDLLCKEQTDKLNVDKNIELFLLEGGKKVLFIDDCIDTGYTLKIIEDHFKLKYPGNDYRIAVATVSHRHPVIQPDYQLYNRVLLRFPWANDVKKNEESCYC